MNSSCYFTILSWQPPLRISAKFCQILKEVLPLSALAIHLNSPKTKEKFCCDSQNERKALPSFFSVSHRCSSPVFTLNVHSQRLCALVCQFASLVGELFQIDARSLASLTLHLALLCAATFISRATSEPARGTFHRPAG